MIASARRFGEPVVSAGRWALVAMVPPGTVTIGSSDAGTPAGHIPRSAFASGARRGSRAGSGDRCLDGIPRAWSARLGTAELGYRYYIESFGIAEPGLRYGESHFDGV